MLHVAKAYCFTACCSATSILEPRIRPATYLFEASPQFLVVASTLVSTVYMQFSAWWSWQYFYLTLSAPISTHAAEPVQTKIKCMYGVVPV